MTDIAEHKWNSSNDPKINGWLCELDEIRPNGDLIIGGSQGGDAILINKSDAIAIAKHFGLIETETEYLLKGENGKRLKESIAELNNE